MRKPLLALVCLLILSSCKEKPSYSWEEDLHARLLRDFDKTEAQVTDQIREYIPDVTVAQMRAWEESKALEYMVLDGKKRYFHNAVPNLFRIDSACHLIKYGDAPIPAAKDSDIVVNIPAIISAVKSDGHSIAVPRRMRITYTLSVHADAVPAGETIRCWLPYPRRDVARQQDVKLISAGEPGYVISPDRYLHSTLYLEETAVAGTPTVFTECFELTSYGEWTSSIVDKVLPYDISSEIYREYTSERENHVVFTPHLRALADSLTSGIDNPYLKARSIFHWIYSRFPWASAREYSTIENIPMYVLENGHGDCGMKSLLLITLCRLCGIPAHFQSGFMLHPHEVNLHDWAELYFEGVGWVPVDMSFGIPSFASGSEQTWFYLGGIDSWRLVVNNDYGMPLFPPKNYPRSETVDFQRGEVEWSGGNLYFSDWSWDIDVEYLP